MPANYVAISIKALDEGAKPDLAELKLKLDELKGRVAEARADVSTAEADAKLTDLEAKLAAVDKKLVSPRIDVAGAARANAQITGVEADLGRLDAAAAESAAAQEAAAARSAKSSGVWAGAGDKLKMALLGIGIGAAVAVNAAGKYQDASTHLVTDAGESASALRMVQQGMLAISAATGTASADVVNGMYHVESAGFHGAQGLAVLKVAAEGAKVGGADLDTVSKSLTGTLNAYGMSSKNSAEQTRLATSMMNQLISAVGAGDMRMQDLASSLGNVAPVAAAAKVSFAQVGGALATMTAQNMTAQQATQDLRHLIVSLENPNAVARKEMTALGLSASDLSANLGKRGLASTIQMITDAARQNAGALGQTYTQALAKASGGTTGLTVALMLSGSRMDTFKGNIATVAAAAAKGGAAVDNWGAIQQTFAFKTAQAKASVEAMGISLGMALLPAVTAVLAPMAQFLAMIASNKAASIALAAVIGALLAGAIGAKLAGALRDMTEGLKAGAEGVGWLIGKLTAQTAAQEAQTAATEAGAVAQGEMDAAMTANPIGLIIAAIAALIVVVVLLVTHWKTVWKEIRELTLDNARVFMTAMRDIAHWASVPLDWIKAHWPLLLGILTGPIGLAAALISGHWRQITAGASRMFHDVVSFFASLPGRILSAVGDLGNLLFGAGQRVIQGLINGVISMIGGIGNAMGSVAGELKSFLPFSPAKKGPLSGSGSPENSGRSIVRLLAQGIRSGLPEASGAMGGVAGAIAPRGGYGAYGAGGGRPQQLELTLAMSDNALLKAMQVTVRQAGGDPLMFQKKVAYR